MSLTRFTLDLLQTYLSRTEVPPDELPALIRKVHHSLVDISGGETSTAAEPTPEKTGPAPPSPPAPAEKAVAAPKKAKLEKPKTKAPAKKPKQTPKAATPKPAPSAKVTETKPAQKTEEKPEIAAKPELAVPLDQAVTKDVVTCLLCGKKGKTLKLHLRSKHDLSAEDYRKQVGLGDDVPLIAPSYTASRRKMAKKAGLGNDIGKKKTRKTKPKGEK